MLGHCLGAAGGVPTLGAAEVSNVVIGRGHALVTLAALCSNSIVDGEVLQVLSSECRLLRQRQQQLLGGCLDVPLIWLGHLSWLISGHVLMRLNIVKIFEAEMIF